MCINECIGLLSLEQGGEAAGDALEAETVVAAVVPESKYQCYTAAQSDPCKRCAQSAPPLAP